MRYKFLISFLLIFCSLGGVAEEFVPVFQVGRISFRIQKTEVSNEEYCRFLNSCARVSDPYRLWNPLMQEHFFGGILREQKNGEFFYRVKPDYKSLPATCISWTAAARYCNYLSFGKPNTGKSELGTTEGNQFCGAYDTQQFSNQKFIRSNQPYRRNTSAAYFLPTQEEWRLAAWGTAKPQGKTFSEIFSNIYAGHWKTPFPHLSVIDANGEAPSYAGALNMGGNVAEWVESKRDNFFLALGGSCIRGRYSLLDSFSEGDEPDKPIASFGIRPASAPAPKILSVNLPPETSKTDLPVLEQNYVEIGEPGNIEDPLYYKGRVDYVFELSRYALTNAEYVTFLNAVATQNDPYGLYNPDMATGVCGGILRKQDSDGNYSYSCKPGYEKRPVVYIGFHDIMRYCNWLHFGRPEKSCGPQVTEGTDQDGAYDTRECAGVVLGKKKASSRYGKRNPNAKYFIPNDDEWYKAGHYDPTRLGTRKYHDYPLRTSMLPENRREMPFACNYLRDGVHLGIGAPYYLAEVNDYPSSDTYFGCRQMAGNVWEFVEPNAIAEGLNLRGSSFGYTEFGMGAWNCDIAGVADELNVFGARIARRSSRQFISPPARQEQIRARMRHGSISDLLAWSTAMALLGSVATVSVIGILFYSHRWICQRKKGKEQ